MHYRLHDFPSIVTIRSSAPLATRQERLQALPHLLYQVDRPMLIDRAWRRRLTRSWQAARRSTLLVSAPIVIVARPGLMPTPPRRPAQDCRCTALDRQDQLPQQAPNFRTTQPDRSPRWALKFAKLLAPSRLRSPFFGAAAAPLSLRMTLKKALTHIAKVMWRYQPVNERTS